MFETESHSVAQVGLKTRQLFCQSLLNTGLTVLDTALDFFVFAVVCGVFCLFLLFGWGVFEARTFDLPTSAS